MWNAFWEFFVLPRIFEGDRIVTREMFEQIRENMRIRGARPDREQIQDMIDRGAINERGEVLLQGPATLDEIARYEAEEAAEAAVRLKASGALAEESA